ncbi:MAG: hypothetical protein Aurels2KO_44070 [Aureliella sp.]
MHSPVLPRTLNGPAAGNSGGLEDSKGDQDKAAPVDSAVLVDLVDQAARCHLTRCSRQWTQTKMANSRFKN